MPDRDGCSVCDAERDPADLAWAFEPPATWLCPACARAHLRDIEAKLAPEWWGPST